MTQKFEPTKKKLTITDTSNNTSNGGCGTQIFKYQVNNAPVAVATDPLGGVLLPADGEDRVVPPTDGAHPRLYVLHVVVPFGENGISFRTLYRKPP